MKPFVKFEIVKSSIPKKQNLRMNINQQVAQAINRVMSEVFDESQELVPVKTGALKESGVFIPAKEIVADGERPQAYITYGNDDVDYAVYVHEELENHHTAPTQAKYLEQPLAQSNEKLMSAIRVATIKGVLKGWKKRN